MKIEFINLEKIKRLGKRILDKVTSKNIKGYASIDKPWEKFKFKNFTEPNIPDMSFSKFFSKRSKINQCKLASICHESTLTNELLDEKVEQYAKAFKTIGVKPMDIVPICLPNITEAIIIFLALNKIGAITTFLHSASSKKSIEDYLKKYDAKLFITTNKQAKEISKNNKTKIISVSLNDCLNVGENTSDFTREYIEKNDCEIEETKDLISLKTFEKYSKNCNVELQDNFIGDYPAIILYTSGSTGSPKPIVLTNENLIAEITYLTNTTHMQLGPKGVSLQTVSFGYPYGILVSTLFPIYVGKTVGLTPSLNQSNASFYIDSYKPKYIQAMPPFFNALINKKVDLSSVKYAITGGAPMSTEGKKKFKEMYGINLLDGGGAGEIGACATTGVFSKYKIDSIGKPLVGTNVKVIDEKTGEELKYGEVGFLCFTGKNVMKEYFGLEEETKESKIIDKEGTPWIQTDTYARIDEKGYIYILGRKTRCFITFDEEGSAYKVYCDQVQNILNSMKEIRESAVVDKEIDGNSVPMAYIVLENENQNIEELKAKITAFCNQSILEKFAIPSIFEFVKFLPVAESGKTDYKLLKEQANSKQK